MSWICYLYILFFFNIITVKQSVGRIIDDEKLWITKKSQYHLYENQWQFFWLYSIIYPFFCLYAQCIIYIVLYIILPFHHFFSFIIFHSFPNLSLYFYLFIFIVSYLYLFIFVVSSFRFNFLAFREANELDQFRAIFQLSFFDKLSTLRMHSKWVTIGILIGYIWDMFQF